MNSRIKRRPTNLLKREDSADRATSILRECQSAYLHKLNSQYKIEKSTESMKRSLQAKGSLAKSNYQSLNSSSFMKKDQSKSSIDPKHMPKLFNNKFASGMKNKNKRYLEL